MTSLKEKLSDFKLVSNPFTNFNSWYSEAKEIEQNVDAMALATCTKDAVPSVRYVLHKGIVEEAFLFFSHYTSPKGSELLENPLAEIAFYWHETKKQIRIKGEVTKCSLEESDKYFSSRGRESQIASIISNQSKEISSRGELVSSYERKMAESSSQSLPRPKDWGGYLITPTSFEFFLYGEHRLNDRFLYNKSKLNGEWNISRLQP